MRLIDADKLEPDADYDDGEYWAYSLTQIQNAPTVKECKTERWISVKERLPEKSGWYITTEIATDNFKYVREMWFSVCTGWRYYDPIAWMPLPEPYREEGEK